MSTGSHPRFPGFLTTLVQGFSSKLFYRNLSQKVKGKRPKLTNIKQKDSVDIEGILKRPGAVVVSAESLVVDSSETTKGIEIKKWQASRQRTNLLKQGERRVAVIAVVTMLIGFAAIKLMFYGAEKRKKASDTATQPT
ncbi:unnamed protein product [Porites lobata]|uniref:Uncharacterized protein n=1 Tax=Porites lobata TaxID=104759 RepID=A0ABN8NMS8_9CNID|nr:unnamed protein product [Porites lobata]